MNRSLVLSAVLLCSTALATTASAQHRKPGPGQMPDESKMYVPASPGQAGWHAYGTPAQIAAMVDQSVAKLQNVWFGYAAISEVPDGRAKSEGIGAILSPTKYHLEFITFGHSVRDAVGRGYVIADGRRATVHTSAGYTKPVPVSQLNRLAGLDLPKQFPARFDELVFAGLGNRQRPLSAYIAAVQKPGSGYVATSEMVLRKLGKTALQYRLLVRRTPAAAKRLGQLSFEIVIDAKYKLPVSGKMMSIPLKGLPTKLSWGARWTLSPANVGPDAYTIPAGL